MDNYEASIINRVPLITYFAGMRGDTISMVKFGWQLNVHKEEDYARDGLMIRITGKHDGFNLRMISGTMMFDRYHARDEQFLQRLSSIPFEIKIEYIAQNLIISNQQLTATIARNWTGTIDILNPRNPKSFDDYYGFPERKDSIFIPENKIWTVQEHLDALMKIQQPTQDEILRRKLNENRDSKQIFKLMAV